MTLQPDLSICIPTYHRPVLFERALRSAMATDPVRATSVELVISDNSTEDATEQIARRMLSSWPGPQRYVRNRPGVGAEPNFNRCIELSTGRYIQILHDDDYLLPGGVDAILDAVHAADQRAYALLFGVHVVDENERVLRRRGGAHDRYLPPPEALANVLSNSSYVRFPAIVVRRDAYDEVGTFDVTVRNPTDFDMWSRLFARYGVRTVATTTVAYTVHRGALTEEMFQPEMFGILQQIFDRAASYGILPTEEIRRHQASFFHQFILAASFRRLRAGDRAGARRIMAFFQLPAVRRLGLSPKWLPVRVAFNVATLGARST